MNIDEFEFLMDGCIIEQDGGGNVVFKPYRFQNGIILQKIVPGSKMPLNEFYNNVKNYNQEYQNRKKIKQQKAEHFSKMSPQQAAELPLEKKIEYFEMLFPDKMRKGELIEVCRKNADNIRACLFNIDFPQSFWDREKKLADRYVALIASRPEITEKMENWAVTSLDDKKEIIQQAREVFKYVYGVAPNIHFFKPEEYDKKGLSDDTHIDAAYNDGKGNIYFNLDRLDRSNNFFAISVLFHEATHYRQDVQSFDNELIDRLFRCNAEFAATYEEIDGDHQSADYGDLRSMQPTENHAYALQEYVEQQLMEKTGISKTDDRGLDAETKNLHNKAFSMAKIAQYHSAKNR